MSKALRQIRVSTDAKNKLLYPLGDVHWGSPTCDQAKFKGYLAAAKKKNAWIFLMGDLIENSTRASVGAGVYEQIQQPQEQLNEILDTLYPYKDRIIGMLTGNHEERTFNLTGLDISEVISKSLGIPYARYGAFIRATVGEVGYTIYASHGGSGSATPGGKLNAILKYRNVADADLYLMGHVHDLLTTATEEYYFDTHRKSVQRRRRNFVITGSFLHYEDSYAQAKNYAPGKIGAPRIRLDGEKQDVHISI